MFLPGLVVYAVEELNIPFLHHVSQMLCSPFFFNDKLHAFLQWLNKRRGCSFLTDFTFQQTCTGCCVGQCVVWKRMTVIPLPSRRLGDCHLGLLALTLADVQDWVGLRSSFLLDTALSGAGTSPPNIFPWKTMVWQINLWAKVISLLTITWNT